MATPISYTVPVYTAADGSLIDIQAVMSEGAPAVPYTVSKNDAETADLYVAITTGSLSIAPYVAPTPAPVYIPAALVRARLQTAGKWEAAIAAMSPAQLAWFCTLELGVLPNDATVIGLLNAIGASPSVILARL